ncbi:MAG: hypothetical protein WBP64_08760, partial [Nitrososphaeraceae archaeon]
LLAFDAALGPAATPPITNIFLLSICNTPCKAAIIRVQYPSSWEKKQFGKNFIVGFVSASRHDSGVLENVMISSIKLSSPNTSLNNFGNTRISALESQYQDFHLVSSGPFITSTGSPLYKIEYTHTDGILPITTTEIWSLKGADAYLMSIHLRLLHICLYFKR